MGLFAPGRSDPEFFWVNGLYVCTSMERRRRPSVQVPIEQRPKELFHGPSSSKARRRGMPLRRLWDGNSFAEDEERLGSSFLYRRWYSKVTSRQMAY